MYVCCQTHIHLLNYTTTCSWVLQEPPPLPACGRRWKRRGVLLLDWSPPRCCGKVRATAESLGASEHTMSHNYGKQFRKHFSSSPSLGFETFMLYLYENREIHFFYQPLSSRPPMEAAQDFLFAPSCSQILSWVSPEVLSWPSLELPPPTDSSMA